MVGNIRVSNLETAKIEGNHVKIKWLKLWEVFSGKFKSIKEKF